ncbi:hypothetical protein [Virgibacillus ainsalahensis]
MGIQNYYSAASRITIDLSKLNNRLNKTLYNRLNEMRKETAFQDFSKSLQKRYKRYECKTLAEVFHLIEHKFVLFRFSRVLEGFGYGGGLADIYLDSDNTHTQKDFLQIGLFVYVLIKLDLF